jgi:hypothetical protein
MTYLKSINIDSPLTSFGQVNTSEETPTLQAHFAYDLSPVNFRTFTGTGGSATFTDGMATVQSGTSVGGYGVIRTLRSVIYRAGQAGVARFTAKFTAGVANSGQIAGLFNIGDGFCFGYNGTSFGILYRHGGVSESRVIEVTGASGGSTNLTLTLNSVAYVIPLTSGTVQHNAYEIATWLESNQSVWNAYQNDDTVVIISNTDGALSGTYSYSHATSTGTITQTRAGVTKTEDWTARASWNENTVSWIDPTKLNVFEVHYPYLGAGNVTFWVMDNETDQMIKVHTLRYANLNTVPSLRNPSLRIGIASYSLGSTTNLTTQSASVFGGMQGKQSFTRNPRAVSATKNSNSTTAQAILSVRNREVFNGYYNQGEIQPLILSLFNGSTSRAVVFEISTSATLGGEPNWQYLGDSLITEYDISATTATGGNPLFQFTVAPNTAERININEFRTRLPPTIVMTISARQLSAGGTASDWGVSVTNYEDVF